MRLHRGAPHAFAVVRLKKIYGAACAVDISSYSGVTRKRSVFSASRVA